MGDRALRPGDGLGVEAARLLARSPATIPALLMVAVFVALAAADGGYFERSYLPAGLFAVALLAVAVMAVGVRRGVPRTVGVAVGLLVAYAAWSYLSILWAGDAGVAWGAANLAVLYAACFAIFALWPMGGRAATAILIAFGLGVAGLGVVTLLRGAAADDLSTMFVGGRFVAPVGYGNGGAALWSMALLPCLLCAARREVWAPLRGLALGGAGVLACLGLLTQSRGWLLALPLALVVFVAITGGRARIAVALAGVLGALWLSLDPILGVFRAYEADGPLGPPLEGAVSSILTMAAMLAVVGTVVALVDRRIELSAPAARQVAIGTTTVFAVMVVAAVAVGLATLGDPIGRASDALGQLTSVNEPSVTGSGSSRFGSLSGQNRVDFWRVAVEQFEDRPVVGAGAGNFQDAYLREGRSDERPRSPHSFPIRVLSQTGLIGALLIAGAIGAALVAAAGALRARSGLGSAAAGTAIAVFAYWALHGAIDWLYELPATAAPAFAMLGLGAALAPRSLDASQGSASVLTIPRPVRLAALTGLLLAAVAGLGLPYLAQREIDRAAEIWSASPDAAAERLRRAAALNPLSSEPHATAAAIALRTGRLQVARQEFEAVLERSPDSAYSLLQLGAIASKLDQRDEAMARLESALEASPRNELIKDSLERVRNGATLDPEAIYDEELERRLAQTGDA